MLTIPHGCIRQEARQEGPNAPEQRRCASRNTIVLPVRLYTSSASNVTARLDGVQLVVADFAEMA